MNCGHPAPLLLDAEGRVTTLTPRSFHPPLGMPDLAPARHAPDTWDFPPGVTLLLYTDGISEARKAAGAFYDPAGWLTGRESPTSARPLSTLVDDVRRFSGGLATDDTALLAVHRPRPHAASAARW
ncbi:PP2C family protein-serine/threonine phosphatase [Streptomyces sp. NPDC020412]|uniref:PP2C family protein-serine/threonine phosphatase n=1 Tax=Streptomyces sp. NPDC020412 TaxID=3365073 RepID=UPI00378BA88B